MAIFLYSDKKGYQIMIWPEKGDIYELVGTDYDLARIYIVNEIRIQYQCELGPESLVELRFHEEGFFDPMWITIEVINLMLQKNVIKKLNR